ncbi:MAG: cold shock domain-containing protein [Phycisphaeraceae bacterium]|nr:cold shock domain-containing protein [Phycisphaeraceae bacterium]
MSRGGSGRTRKCHVRAGRNEDRSAPGKRFTLARSRRLWLVQEPPVSDQAKKLDNVEGTVKWFDPRKGYGFIIGPEGQDIFVHYTAIAGEGFRALQDGISVKYSAELTPTGWKATSVARTEPAEIVVLPRQNYTRSPRRSGG